MKNITEVLIVLFAVLVLTFNSYAGSNDGPPVISDPSNPGGGGGKEKTNDGKGNSKDVKDDSKKQSEKEKR